MMIHPDPGSDDFNIKNLVNPSTAEGDKIPSVVTIERKATQRSMLQEKDTKKQKTALIKVFCSENSVDFEKVHLFCRVFMANKPNLSVDEGSASVDFEKFCKMTQVEQLAKYRKLFDFFDLAKESEIDFRCFLMSLLGFVDVEKHKKIDLCFEIFDDDKNGYLDELELRDILRSNHLASSDKVIEKKLTKIMKNQENNRLDRQAFDSVVSKFPNIVFPSFV